MSQLSYTQDLVTAFAGMKVDSRYDEVESKLAEEAIAFGRGVGAEAGVINSIRLPKKDNASLLYDADFVSLNSIAVSVNGVAITPVVFATDHDVTAAALAAAINALDNVTCSLDAADTNNRTFLIERTDGAVIAVTTTVTLGASQATGTPTYSADDVFRGIALHTHKATVNGLNRYEQYEPVSVLRKGQAWVETGVAVTADETAYVDATGAIGKFTNVSSGNMVTGGKFRSTVGVAGLAIVEINLP